MKIEISVYKESEERSRKRKQLMKIARECKKRSSKIQESEKVEKTITENRGKSRLESEE